MSNKSLMLRFVTKALPDRAGQVEAYGREAGHMISEIADGCDSVADYYTQSDERPTEQQRRASNELRGLVPTIRSLARTTAYPRGRNSQEQLRSIVENIEIVIQRSQRVPEYMDIVGDHPYAEDVRDRIEYLQDMLPNIRGVLELESVRNEQLSNFISHLTAQRNQGIVDHADLLIMADWLDEQEAVEIAQQLRNPNLNVSAAVHRILGGRSWG